MIKKIISIVFIVIFLTFSLSPSVMAEGRLFIGDQEPDGYELGRQADPADVITTQLSILPGVFPEDENLRNQLIWLRYPANNYTFRTAPSADSSFFANKMEDASSSVTDSAANLLFSLSKSMALLANNIVLIVFDNYVGNGIFRSIGKVVDKISSFEEGGFFNLLMILMLCVLGITIVVQLIKSQIMKALTSFLVAAVCIACIIGYSVNIDKIIPATMGFINNTTGIALMATTYMKDMPVGEDNDEDVTVDSMAGETTMLQQGLIQTTNALWHSTIGAPWANGMFGSSDPNKLKLLPQEVEAINSDVAKVFEIKWWGPHGPELHVNWQELMPWAEGELPTDRAVYMDTVWLASSNEVKYSMLSAITNTTDRIRETGQTSVVYTLGQGQTSSGYHMMVAFLSILPTIIFFAFIISVGVPIFIAQFIIMFLLLILPFALLLGIAGDKGMQATLIFMQKLLGAIAIKIIYGFYLSLVLLFTVAITQMPNIGVGMNAFLLCIIFAFAIKYKKKFYELVMSVISLDLGKIHYEDRAKGFLTKAMATAYTLNKLKNMRYNAHSGGVEATNLSNPQPHSRYSANYNADKSYNPNETYNPEEGVNNPHNTNSQVGWGANNTTITNTAGAGTNNADSNNQINAVNDVNNSSSTNPAPAKNFAISKESPHIENHKKPAGVEMESPYSEIHKKPAGIGMDQPPSESKIDSSVTGKTIPNKPVSSNINNNNNQRENSNPPPMFKPESPTKAQNMMPSPTPRQTENQTQLEEHWESKNPNPPSTKS